MILDNNSLIIAIDLRGNATFINSVAKLKLGLDEEASFNIDKLLGDQNTISQLQSGMSRLVKVKPFTPSATPFTALANIIALHHADTSQDHLRLLVITPQDQVTFPGSEDPAIFFQNILESLPNMIFLKDAKELRLQVLNQAGEHLLGIERKNVIGKNDYDLFPTEQADFFTIKDREVLNSGQSSVVEQEPIQTPRGIRWLRTRKIPLYSQTGEPTYLLGISEDITNIKLQNDELHKKDLKFKAAQEAAKIGTWHYSFLDNKMEWSEQIYRIFHRPVYLGEPTIAEVQSYFHPEDLGRAIKHFTDYKHRDDVLTYDLRVLDTADEEVWIRIQGSLIYEADNKVVSAGGTCQNISSTKKLELENKELHLLANQIQSVAKLGGWELDLETNETRWTPEVYNIYGIPPSTPVGKIQAMSFYAPHDQSRLAEMLAEGAKTGQPFQGDFEFVDTHKKHKWVRVLGESRHENGKQKLVGTFQDITETKKLVDQLSHKSEELDCFFNLSVDLMCIVGIDGYFKRINPSFTELLGFTEEELKSRPFREFILPEDRAASRLAIESALSGKPLKSFQNRYLTKRGDYKYLSWSASLDQKSNCIFAAARDMTEFQKSTQELNTYSLALNTYAIIARTDRFGIINYVNENFCNVSGYSREELIGKTHRLINSGFHDRQFFREMWDTIQSGKVWRGEIRNKAKDGSLYWVDTTITPFFDSDGTIKEFVSFRYDITEKKNTEIRLREQKGHLDRIIANSPGMVYQFRLDPDGKTHFPFVSSQSYEIFEINEDEYNKNTNLFLELTHPEESDELTKKIMESATKLTVFEHEGRILTKKGNIKWYHARSVPTRLRDGTVIWDGILIDMTEQRKLEFKLQEQQRISEHQARLASIGELAAGVGHEINNPLAIIKAFSHMLNKQIRDGKFTPDNAREILGKIDHATERIAKIVRGLRTFSRDDQYVTDTFDLADALRESVELVQEIFEKEQIDISLNYDVDKTFHINGTRSRIQQVIMNLLSNARDALEKNHEKLIALSLEQRGDDIVLMVRDNGPGIPDEVKPKIFNPFFTTKEVNKGTGLGLALVHSIVKDHGGTIKVSTPKSGGTIFEIMLPKSQSDCHSETIPAASAAELPRLTGMKILVVDDEQGIREILSEMALDTGAEVDQAVNGKDGLEKALQNGYDLIISDIKMPLMNGPDFLKKLRSTNTLLKQPKFIFITGGININLESETDELSSLIDGYIMKPFQFDEITKLIVGLLTTKSTSEKVA